MADLELRIRNWTEHANRGVEPVTVPEVWNRSAVARVPDVPAPRRRWQPIAAVIVLLAVAAGVAALLSARGDDAGRVATDPEPVAPHVPSPYDLFPAAVISLASAV